MSPSYASFELVTAVYAGYLAASALASPGRRAMPVAVSLAMLAGVLATAAWAPPFVRAWAPVLYLLAGYWTPGVIVAASAGARHEAFERLLARSDDAVRPWLPSVPAALAVLPELAYLMCYALVPACFTPVFLLGTDGDIERFWASVLASGFACYATLPWLITYPPRRAVEGHEGPGLVRRLNVFVLGRFSHGWTTFPSGHVAVSWTSALSLAWVWPAAGAAAAIVAAAVSVGAAAGRYHYVVDVLAGLLVAALAMAVTAMVVTW